MRSRTGGLHQGSPGITGRPIRGQEICGNQSQVRVKSWTALFITSFVNGPLAYIC